jgi:hypothetical protein
MLIAVFVLGSTVVFCTVHSLLGLRWIASFLRNSPDPFPPPELLFFFFLYVSPAVGLGHSFTVSATLLVVHWLSFWVTKECFSPLSLCKIGLPQLPSLLRRSLSSLITGWFGFYRSYCLGSSRRLPKFPTMPLHPQSMVKPLFQSTTTLSPAKRNRTSHHMFVWTE